MPNPCADTGDHRLTVEDLLRQAVAETDPLARKKLLGKATYWNDRALKAAKPFQRRAAPRMVGDMSAEAVPNLGANAGSRLSS